MEFPVISWFDDIIKQSFNSVFAGLNTTIESYDLLNRLKNKHISSLLSQVGQIKILGMVDPIPLEKLYYPTMVSSDIRRRIYNSEWKIINSNKNGKHTENNKIIRGDVFLNNHEKVVILGGPGAGKTTFLKFIALSNSNSQIFSKTKLEKQLFPIFVSLPIFFEIRWESN